MDKKNACVLNGSTSRDVRIHNMGIDRMDLSDEFVVVVTHLPNIPLDWIDGLSATCQNW